MSAVSDLEKLKILIPHWVEHNKEHGHEFLRWAEHAEKLGSQEVSLKLKEAFEEMPSVNDRLLASLEIIGDSAEHHE